MIELILNVNSDMRICKTRFWTAMQTNPICDPEHVTLAAALQLTGEKRLESWWEKPGFKKWFCAEDEFEVKLSSAKYMAIDTLLDVMSNPDTAPSARVAAAKEVLANANKTENDDKNLEKLLEKIAGVSKIEDLKKYLK